MSTRRQVQMEMQWYRIYMYTAVLCAHHSHHDASSRCLYYVRTRSKQMYIQFNYIR